jgi:hypothetical protein
MQEMGAWGRMATNLTLTGGVTVNPMQYNGTVSGATVNAATATFSGSILGTPFTNQTLAAIDAALIGGTLSTPSYTATFGTKDVGSGKLVTVAVSGLTYIPSLGPSVTVPVTSLSTTASITAAPLTLSAAPVTIQTKDYDGTDAAIALGDPVISSGTIYGGDVVTASVTGAVFQSPDAGTQNATVTMALSNSNYTPTNATATVSGTINKLTVTINTDTVVPAPIQYNGSAETSVASGAVTVPGVISGDNVTVNIDSIAYINPDVGSTKSATVNVTLSGSKINNYQPTTFTAMALVNTGAITAAQLTVTGVTANSKPADGTTTLTTSGGTGTLVGTIFGSDAPSVASITASFPSPAVGCYSITGTANLTGSGSTNYSATANLGTACITGAPETPKAPIPIRTTEHGNATLIDDRKANAFVAAFQTPVAAGAPPRKPASASDYTAGLKAINAARFIR